MVAKSPSVEAPSDHSEQDRSKERSSPNRRTELLPAVRAYAAANYRVVPLQPRDKKPDGSWNGPRLTNDELSARFATGAANAGLAFGAPSNGLVDLDFDSSVAARIGDVLLGQLPADGRVSAPRSHRLVICAEARAADGPCRHVEFKLPGSVADHPRLQGAHGRMILEVRANGCYSMVPPSTHPSGELVQADGDLLAPPQWSWPQVVRAAGLVAFLDVCVRLYPPVGTRHVFCMALTGALMRTIMSYDEFKQFAEDESELIKYVNGLVHLVGELARGGKSHKLNFAAKSLSKIKSKLPATGLNTVLTLLGVPKPDHGRFAFWLGGDADERPLIEHDEIDIRRVLQEAEAAMIEAEAPIFQRGGQLAHVYRQEKEEREVDADGKVLWFRPAGTLVTRPIALPRLRLYLQEYVRFYKERRDKSGETKKIPVPAPTSVARDYAALADEWNLRVLRGTVETPTLRIDCSVIESPGYDRASGLLLDTGGVAFENISDRPAKEDALASLKIIDKVIEGFPFDGNTDGLSKCPSRSTALSMFLSPFVARTVPAVPLHVIDAPVAGHGKTLLADCAAIVATGKEAPKVAQGWDEAEDEKRLSGTLMRGDGIVLIDNVEQPIGGDYLCSVITESVVQVRVLGQTGQIDVPANLLICATGNNIKVRGDMVRRTIKCRMDAGVERPEERKFKIDLRDYVRMHRVELVRACLTILRAFAVTPDRKETLEKLSPYGSFNEWSDRIRGALTWLGESDPCETRESIRDDDPVTANLAALIAAWVSCLGVGNVVEGTGWLTTGEVCTAAERVDHHDGALQHPLLNSALSTIMPKGITPEGLGSRLSKYVDRVVNGYRLRKRQHPETRNKQYLVEMVPKQTAEAGSTGGQGEMAFG